MTPAPSSPVPAVEAELSNEQLLDEYHSAIAALLERCRKADNAEDLAEVAEHLGSTQDARAAVMARMSTPTPGRAAEPNTMGEVEGEGSLFTASAMRRVVVLMNEFRTRAETAEAKVATAVERTKALEEALRPFAIAAMCREPIDRGKADNIACYSGLAAPLVGDLRRAATLLSNPKADR